MVGARTFAHMADDKNARTFFLTCIKGDNLFVMDQITTAAAVAASGEFTLPIRQFLEEAERGVVDFDKLLMCADTLDETMLHMFPSSTLLFATNMDPDYQEMSTETAVRELIETIRGDAYEWIGLYIPRITITEETSPGNWHAASNLGSKSAMFMVAVRVLPEEHADKSRLWSSFPASDDEVRARHHMFMYEVGSKPFQPGEYKNHVSFAVITQLFKSTYARFERESRKAQVAIPTECRPPRASYRSTVYMPAPQTQVMYTDHPSNVVYVESHPCTMAGCCQNIARGFALSCGIEAQEFCCLNLLRCL